MSQFSEHDPNGQAVRAAGGLTRYDRRGWRRWFVPAVVGVVLLAGIGLLLAYVAR